MAQFTVTIPDDILATLIDAFAKLYNYQETVLDPDTGEEIPNPESKVKFAKRQIGLFLKGVYKSYKVDTAMDDAQDDASEEADTETEELDVE